MLVAEKLNDPCRLPSARSAKWRQLSWNSHRMADWHRKRLPLLGSNRNARFRHAIFTRLPFPNGSNRGVAKRRANCRSIVVRVGVCCFARAVRGVFRSGRIVTPAQNNGVTFLLFLFSVLSVMVFGLVFGFYDRCVNHLCLGVFLFFFFFFISVLLL